MGRWTHLRQGRLPRVEILSKYFSATLLCCQLSRSPRKHDIKPTWGRQRQILFAFRCRRTLHSQRQSRHRHVFSDFMGQAPYLTGRHGHHRLFRRRGSPVVGVARCWIDLVGKCKWRSLRIEHPRINGHIGRSGYERSARHRSCRSRVLSPANLGLQSDRNLSHRRPKAVPRG